MNLTNEQIYSKIEEIYKTEKGKPFISHLIRSFLPTSRSTFMLSNEKNKKMRCSITGIQLISKEDLVKFQVENMDEVLKNFCDRILGKATNNVVVDNFQGKLFALESEKSDKLLCLPAVEQLVNFASTELIKGNKHIGFIVKDERTKEFNQPQNKNTNSNNVIIGSKEQAESQNPQNKPAKPKLLHSTTSLGDFDALKELKNKLEKSGN